MPTEDRLPAWARERGKNLTVRRLDRARTALIVVDLQEVFVAGEAPFATLLRSAIVPNVNRLIAAARQASIPVIFLRQTTGTEPPYAVAGWQNVVSPAVAAMRLRMTKDHPLHEVHAGLDRLANDVTIDKFRYSAFARNSSNMDDILQDGGIDTLIVSGAATNVCCETTIRDAAMLGYRVLLVSDATGAMTIAEHEAALLNLAVIFCDVQITDRAIALMTVDDGD